MNPIPTDWTGYIHSTETREAVLRLIAEINARLQPPKTDDSEYNDGYDAGFAAGKEKASFVYENKLRDLEAQIARLKGQQ